LIDRNRTGEIPPTDAVFEEWGKHLNAGSTNNLAPSPATTGKRQKVPKSTKRVRLSSIFGLIYSNEELLCKIVMEEILFVCRQAPLDPNIANNYPDLPPAQRRKKFIKHIKENTEQIAQYEKQK